MWSIQILARRGMIKAGKTQIELVPDAKRKVSNSISKESRSIVMKINGGKDSIERKGQTYSPSSLLNYFENRKHSRIMARYGVYRNWRIVQHPKSLHDEAH